MYAASRLQELFATAGFRNVRVTWDIRRIVYDSFDDYWEPFEAGPGRVGQIYRHLPDAARRAVVEEVRQRTVQFEFHGSHKAT